jgi:hypothetical protein
VGRVGRVGRVGILVLAALAIRRFVLVDIIGPVESVLHQVPCGMGSGWSTWEQAMSSEPR